MIDRKNRNTFLNRWEICEKPPKEDGIYIVSVLNKNGKGMRQVPMSFKDGVWEHTGTDDILMGWKKKEKK